MMRILSVPSRYNESIEYASMPEPPMILMPPPHSHPKADCRLDSLFSSFPRKMDEPTVLFMPPASLPQEKLLLEKPPRNILHSGRFLDQIEEKLQSKLVPVPANPVTSLDTPFLSVNPRAKVSLYRVPPVRPSTPPLLWIDSIREPLGQVKPLVSVAKRNNTAREKRRVPKQKKQSPLGDIDFKNLPARKPVANRRVPLATKLAVPKYTEKACEFVPVSRNTKGEKDYGRIENTVPIIPERYTWYKDAITSKEPPQGRLEWNQEYSDLIVNVFDKLDQTGWIRDKLDRQVDHSRKVVLSAATLRTKSKK